MVYWGEISFSDFTSDITRVMAERKSPPIHATYCFESGLDYILSHFQGDLWPRTISTKATGGAQIPVRSKEEALKWFEQDNFLDCKINGYPKRIEWKGINLQAPNFIFIDSTWDASNQD